MRRILPLALVLAVTTANADETRPVRERVWVPAQFRQVTKKEYMPPQWTAVERREWVPARYTEGTERRYIPARYTEKRVPTCTTRYRTRWVAVRASCGYIVGRRRVREPYHTTVTVTRRIQVPGTGQWVTRPARKLVPGTGQHVVHEERKLVEGTGVWIDKRVREQVPGTGVWKTVERRVPVERPPLLATGQAAPRPGLPLVRSRVLALRDARVVARSLLREQLLSLALDGRKLRERLAGDETLSRVIDARVEAAEETGADFLADGSARVTLRLLLPPVITAIEAHLAK